MRFTVGSSPRGLVVGDFNADGRPDLAVANLLDNSVSVLLGTGAGRFAPAVSFAVGQRPSSVVVGDFNGDGRLDLAVANSDGNSVSVLLGTGAGGFSPGLNFGAGQHPVSVVVADFNGDGALDLTVTSSGGISVLLGTGAGGFSAPVGFAVGAGAASLVVGDFDGDGRPDLAVANSGGDGVTILLNTCGRSGPAPTGPPTPNPSPTSTPPPIGSGLTITHLGGRDLLLSWQPGVGQPQLVRVTGQGFSLQYPPASRLAHRESVPAEASLACYYVGAQGAEGRLLAISNALCIIPIPVAVTSAPPSFTLRVTPSSTAWLFWEPAPGAAGYILAALGTDRVRLLPATTLSATDPTGGRLTCYLLVAQLGTGISGPAAILCSAGTGPPGG